MYVRTLNVENLQSEGRRSQSSDLCNEIWLRAQTVKKPIEVDERPDVLVVDAVLRWLTTYKMCVSVCVCVDTQDKR